MRDQLIALAYIWKVELKGSDNEETHVAKNLRLKIDSLLAKTNQNRQNKNKGLYKDLSRWLSIRITLVLNNQLWVS